MKRWALLTVLCLVVWPIRCVRGSVRTGSMSHRPTANNTASASSQVQANTRSLSLNFTAIPSVSVSLGSKIRAINLAQYVQGGSEPFTYSIVSETMRNAVACSLDGSVLSSDYAYHGGVNTVTVRVADSHGARRSTTVRIKVAIPKVASQVYGIDFSPYGSGQKFADDIGIDQITRRIGIIAPYTQWIRSFTSAHGQELLGMVAHRFGLKVCMGALITGDQAANATEISNLIAHARKGEAECAVIGSETLYRNDATPEQLMGYIDRFRAAVPHVPVTTADVYASLLVNPKLVNDCDFIFVNYYPFWEGKDFSGAIAYLNAEDVLLRHTYPNKEVVVSETGWPSAGKNVGHGVSSQENAANYFLSFESWARAGGRKTFYFEAFDEAWKFTPYTPQEARFGIFDQDGMMKYGKDVFSGKTAPGNWTCKAAPPGNNSAGIQLTSVPAMGDRDFLEGHVSYVDPANYYVVVYVHDGSAGWWMKPYTRSPRTIIDCDGAWATNIVTGNKDAFADQIAAFLIPSTYDPAILLGARSLPPELYANSVANVLVRSRAPRKVGGERMPP